MAILLVLWHHFFHPFFQNVQPDAFLIDLSRFGWSGVDLFFVLSGFLITGILQDTRGKPGYFTNFFARRILRIFPLYFAVLGVIYFVFPLLPDPRFPAYVADSAPDQVWFWTYLTNVKIAANTEWYPHVLPNIYWSLAVEEHFYLLWPFVVFFLKPRVLMRVCILLLGACLLLRTVLTLNGADPLITFVLTPCRIDTLAVGSFLAVLARTEGGLAAARPWAVRLFMLGGLALASIFVVEGRIIAMSDLVRTVGFTLVALFYGSALVLVLTAGPATRLTHAFNNPGLRAFGKYSYALYLLHGPVGTFLVDVIQPERFPRIGDSMILGMTVYCVAAMAVSLGAAWISWHLVERHFLALKRFFRTQDAPTPARGRAPATVQAAAPPIDPT